jgi:hypothetical protein
MPVFDVSGSLKVVGDRAGNLEIKGNSGSTVATEATFLHFSGSAIASVTASSTGVIITINSGSGGGGGGITYYEVAKRMLMLGN